MKTILQINTSLNSGSGASSQLASTFVAAWQARNPDGRVVVRDLARDPVPHLTAERFAAFVTPADKRTADQAAVVAESDALIAELRNADAVVIGLPMYNFGVSSTLKAWFDHIARAGVTFKYTAQGAVGLLADRKVYVLATRGGAYQGTPLDTQTGFVRTFLNFIGLQDVEFVYAEGLAFGEPQRNAALANATATIGRLAGAGAAAGAGATTSASSTAERLAA